MKEFLKWLGINEKVAKIAVWLLIFMMILIIFNVFLESVGFPYYKITVENLSKINVTELSTVLFDFIMSGLNFYATIMLVVRVKDFKKTIKYFIIYLIIATIITNVINYAVCQIFIFGYILGYLFFYGNKNWKYIIYGIGSIIINTIVQYISYLYKIRFVDFSTTGSLNTFIMSIDYFIIMFLIIMIKEIYLKKRGEN